MKTPISNGVISSKKIANTKNLSRIKIKHGVAVGVVYIDNYVRDTKRKDEA